MQMLVQNRLDPSRATGIFSATKRRIFASGQASFFFFSVFLVVCPHWFSPNSRKKKCSFIFLRGNPTQSLHVRTGTVDRPLYSIQNPLVNGFSSDLGQRVVEQHLQRINICKEVQLSEQKEEGKETVSGWYDRSSFDSRDWRRKQGLTRRRTLFFLDDQLYEKTLSIAGSIWLTSKNTQPLWTWLRTRPYAC